MDIFSQHDKFSHARLNMITDQLEARGISSQKVLDAMAAVPREHFVPQSHHSEAYRDGPLPIGEGQTISQPYMVALMTDLLRIKDSSKILEIGTGSGYQTAVLLQLTQFVFSIERLEQLTIKAKSTLAALGLSQAHIITGDGSKGWPEKAPFDGIIVTSAAPSIPETLKQQLADGGRMVIPSGSRFAQQLYVVTRFGDRFEITENTACVFVPLVGAYGWNTA